MAPRLRVLAGTSAESMVPITSLVNTSIPHKLSSRLFEGQVVAHIKGLTDECGNVRDSEYFIREDKAGITWSIQVQGESSSWWLASNRKRRSHVSSEGRFLVPQSADDVLFGNTFDRPLKLPWGTGAVLKFMQYVASFLAQQTHELRGFAPQLHRPNFRKRPHLFNKTVGLITAHSHHAQFPALVFERCT